VTDAVSQPRQTQMSPRDRRRVLIGMALAALVLFLGGALAYVLDFRHQQVCPGGKQWIAQGSDDMGALTYLCPGGLVVTQGMTP